MKATDGEILKTWRVRTSEKGVVLTINGRTYELGHSAQSIAFDIERAGIGWNAPDYTRCPPGCGNDCCVKDSSEA